MLKFAIAIVFPEADIKDIVQAALKNNVHIIDKEVYDASKDYVAYSASYQPYINGSKIHLLFIFGEGDFILADTDGTLAEATTKIIALKEQVLN